MRRSFVFLLFGVFFASTCALHAGVFNPDVQGSDATLADYMLPVTGGGQPGGPAYTYTMGKFEITSQQFCDFLNDAERDANSASPTKRSSNMFFSDNGSVYLDSNMSSLEPIFLSHNISWETSDIHYDVTTLVGTRYSVISDPFGSKAKHAARRLSWMGAMKFCNWLTIDQELGEEHCCYTEGPDIGDWHPVTITTAEWWGKEPAHNDDTTAGRDPNDAERTELVRVYRGYRLFMDDTGLLAPISRPDPNDFNEWLKAAAWDPDAPDTFRTNTGGWHASPDHWMYATGREVHTGADGNWNDSGDPWESVAQLQGPVPVDFYDGTDHGGLFATNDSENRYGFYGMAGNVWEYSQDYGPDLRHRAIYGGSWVSTPYRQAASSAYLNGLVMWADVSFGMRILRVVYPLEVKIVGDDTAASDEFGRTVALDGDYAIVGAHFDDDDGSNSGSAYVYRRDGLKWVQEDKLHASDAAAGDKFGNTVAISGDYAIVGAPSNADAGTDSGSAYVFKRSGTTWTEEAKLVASDAATDDKFGDAVAIEGDFALVGARGDDDNGSVSGSVYVFQRSGTDWIEQPKLTPADGAMGDYFGHSIGISGSYAIIGSHGDDDGAADAGSAYVFKLDGESWIEEAKLTASDPEATDGFGLSVSVSGDVAVVAAPWDDDAADSSGAAYVFRRNGTSWIEEAKLTASDGGQWHFFGHSVSISGDYIVIGAFGHGEPGDNTGAAYAFQYHASNWIQKDRLIASDRILGDQYGQAVAVSGPYALIGAPYDSDAGNHAGTAFIYELGAPSVNCTLTVAADGLADFTTIQDAIDAAIDGDTVLLRDGTYSGPGNRDLDFGGKAITVRGENGPEFAIIDCEGAGRGFHFHSGETAASVIEGLTVINGDVVAADQDGGAIFCTDGSSPTMTNCRFINNTAIFGAAIACESSAPTITGCDFYGNICHLGSGGGISCNNTSDATLTDCTFRGNWAVSGGGIRCFESSPTITGCWVSGNRGGTGGGIYCNRSAAIITDCVVTGNYGPGVGGIYCYLLSPTITNCLVAGNSSGVSGGGIFCSNNSPIITNCSVTGNVAFTTGGGFRSYNSSPTVTNMTISGNTAGNGDGSGAHLEGTGSPQFTSCIIQGNPPQDLLTQGVSLTLTHSDVAGTWPGDGNIDADPLFVGGPGGAWTAGGAYDPVTFEITFTDNTATWTLDEWVGKLVNPDTTQALQLVVVDNTATTMTVLADWDTIDTAVSWVDAGASYQIHDYHIARESPCVEGGDNAALPPDTPDLDGDGDVIEPVPFDLSGNYRLRGCVVDMGAYEVPLPAEMPGDLDGDCDVDPDDVSIFVSCMTPPNVPQYNPACADARFDEDLDVDQADFGLLQRCYSGPDIPGDPRCAN